MSSGKNLIVYYFIRCITYISKYDNLIIRILYLTSFETSKLNPTKHNSCLTCNLINPNLISVAAVLGYSGLELRRSWSWIECLPPWVEIELTSHPPSCILDAGEICYFILIHWLYEELYHEVVRGPNPRIHIRKESHHSSYDIIHILFSLVIHWHRYRIYLYSCCLHHKNRQDTKIKRKRSTSS